MVCLGYVWDVEWVESVLGGGGLVENPGQLVIVLVFDFLSLGLVHGLVVLGVHCSFLQAVPYFSSLRGHLLCCCEFPKDFIE